MKNHVAIVKCPTYDYPQVLTGVREVLEPLGGMRAFVKRGDRVLLKPNLLAGKHPDKCVTTHPSVVKAAASWSTRQGEFRPSGTARLWGAYAALLPRRGSRRWRLN